MSSDASISVIIIDDELPARKMLEKYLQEDSGINVLESCGDPNLALQLINELKPDLIFLDIQMPELTGFELIQKLETPRPFIVFVTAYDKYALKAFEENALDYLLKPFNRERFNKTLIKAKAALLHIDQRQQSEKLEAALETLAAQHKNYITKLPIKEKGKIHFVPVADIMWIESAGSFTKLHLHEGFKTHSHALKRMAEVLDPNAFIRIHKSYMVNLNHVSSIEPYFHGEYIVTLKNSVTLKLSRSYKEKLELILNQYQ